MNKGGKGEYSDDMPEGHLFVSAPCYVGSIMIGIVNWVLQTAEKGNAASQGFSASKAGLRGTSITLHDYRPTFIFSFQIFPIASHQYTFAHYGSSKCRNFGS